MRWLRLTLYTIGGLLAVLLCIAGFAWAADYGVEATVTQTNCAGGSNPYFPTLATTDSSATVQTKLFGITHSVDLTRGECLALRPQNFVVFHIRSGHTLVYEDSSQAKCVYDSSTATGVCA